MTTKTIGTGGDYSTLQSWEDAAPSGTLSAPWEGLCKNQEFTAGVTISGNTTDATNCKILRTDTGASFIDNANKLTNALKYNASNGAAVRSTATYSTLIKLIENHAKVYNLQVQTTASSSVSVQANGGNPNTVANCIFEATGGVAGDFRTGVGSKAINCLFITRSNGANGLSFSANGPQWNFYNCTIVKPSDKGANGNAFNFNGAYPGTAHVVKNCAVFGFGAFYSADKFAGASCGYNASDMATIPGSNNQASATYADQFTGVTDSTIDYRAA